MKKDMIKSIIERSIEDKINIRRNLEMDRLFQTRVAFEVKETFYRIYDYALELNYKVLADIKATKDNEYKCEELYDLYAIADDMFVDFVILLIDNYKVNDEVMF